MSVNNKDICKALFATRDGNHICQMCKKKVIQSTSGYTNLISHLNTKHKGKYMDIFHEVVSNNNNSIDSFFKISTKSNNIIDWMEVKCKK